MNARDDAGATDASEETEPNVGTEQTQTESKPVDYAAELLRVAADSGHTIGDAPLKEETEAEPEQPKAEEPDTETESETETEEEPEEAEEELKPAATKADKLVPLSEVLEERAKKKRANERADKAEALAAQFQAQLAQAVAPRPEEDFRDIHDLESLDRLERSFEATIDLADENPNGAVDVVVKRDSSGKEIRQDFPPEELIALRKRADKAIRKFIPERRTFLQQRIAEDNKAAEVYPEFNDVNSEFRQVAAVAAQKILTGQVLKEPELLLAIGDYARGYLERMKRNGNATQKVKSPEAKRIMESAKQRVAPTPTKTRSFIERGASSVNLEKANKKFEERGDTESAEELVGALLSRSGGGSKRVEPIAE